MSMKHENGRNFVNLRAIVVREASELLYTTFLKVHLLFSPGGTKLLWISSILWKMVKSNFSLRPQTSMIISSKETLNVVVLEFKKVCCWNPWSWRKKDDDKWKYHQKCWFSDVFKAFVKQPFLISQHDKFRNVENFHLQWSSNTYKLFSVDKRKTSFCNSTKSFSLPFCS